MKTFKFPRGGFTLVEIMVIVAILLIVSALAIPNFFRARKRSQATRMLDELRMIDAALDQYAVETNKQSGASVDWPDVQSYLKKDSTLYTSSGKDLLGNPYSDGALTVGATPKLNSTTYDKLSDVIPAEFWSPYYP